MTRRYQFDVDRRAVGALGRRRSSRTSAPTNTFITGDTISRQCRSTATTRASSSRRGPSLGERAFVTAGVRVERISRDAARRRRPPFGRPTDLDADVVWSVNPKISAAWYSLRGAEPTSGFGAGWTKIRGGAGTGHQAADGVRDRRSRTIRISSRSAAAAATSASNRRSPARRSSSTRRGSSNSYDDLIVAVGTRSPARARYRTDNIANARARGLELGASWHAATEASPSAGPGRGSTPRSSASTRCRRRAGAVQRRRSRCIRRPPQQGALDVDVDRTARAVVFVTINGRGEMTDIEPNFGVADVRQPRLRRRVDRRDRFESRRCSKITARVNNLFDRALRGSARLSRRWADRP